MSCALRFQPPLFEKMRSFGRHSPGFIFDTQQSIALYLHGRIFWGQRTAKNPYGNAEYHKMGIPAV
jgi:hypothetical protein